MTPANGFYGWFNPLASGPWPDTGGAALPVPPAGSGPLRGNAWNARQKGAGWYSAGGASVACLGEIFNAHEVGEQLNLGADTPLLHLLLSAWRRWNLDCVSRLDGVFAMALYCEDGLMLYRDPSGLRDLYYWAGPDPRIGFASNLDTLLRLPGVERRLARRALHEYLRLGDIAAPQTMFEGVWKVEAGQLLRWTPDGLRTPPNLPVAQTGPEPPADFAAAVAAFDTHMARSVQVRLRNAQRPAAFLSGGIDSAIICAMAARDRSDLSALTVGFAPPDDEAPVAQRIAAHLGLSHKVLRFSRQDYVAAFELLSERMEQPMADPATPATLLAFEYCRDHFDVVLDGTGADDAVGTMPPRHVRLAVEYASRLPLAVRHGLTRLLRTLPVLSGYTPVLDFEHPADTMTRWNGFSRVEIEALCGEPVSFAHTHFYRTFERFPRPAHYERGSALLNAAPVDRMNQATLITGAPIRYPFCDRETDRFLRQLPVDFCDLPTQPKRILREALARYVPRPIWDLPKHGFNFPLHAFLADDNFSLVRRHLEPALWTASGVLDAQGVQHYATRFIAGDQRMTFRVWALVMLGAWLERHDKLR
jgi:asparagine synthase (glutamine-hydrolysing)